MEFYIPLISLTTVHGVHLPINWTQVSTVSPLGWDTHMDHPPGTSFAPCPCDLTSSFCDLSCCCDRDCATTATNIPCCQCPVAQGQKEGSTPTFTCKYLVPFAPEWHSFFCPVKENTPYLGLFYPPHQAIRDYEKYLAKVRQQQYSYQEEGIRVPDQTYQLHYVYGKQVMMGKDMGGTVVEGPLVLPQPVMEGVCVDTFPVHFLENLDHKCFTIMSPEKCESEAALSLASYLQPSGGVSSGSPSGFLQVIGNLSSLDLVNASVEYKWMEDITNFIKVQGGGIPTAWAQNTTTNLEGSRLPYLDMEAGWCNNVVLAVEYQLAWEGPGIVDIAATFTLGNIPVFPEQREDPCTMEKNQTCSTPPEHKLPPFSATPLVFLLQHFMVDFHHRDTSSNASCDPSDHIPEVDDVVLLGLSERSGKPGYLVGRPVLAGYVMYKSTEEENSTTDGLLSVSVNDSTGLYLWRPDESGSCHTSRLEKVTFGIDMISSCLYTWSDVTCSDLKEMLEATLYSLVQAEVISTLGWPNASKEEDFLPIIIGEHKENKTSGIGCDVPLSLEYRIIYQNVLDEPSPIHVMYQIVGVSFRVHYKTLHLSHHTSADSLLLTSSAVFFQHSKPSEVSRFWKAMEDRWCEKGICWREILWPWTDSMTRMGWVSDGNQSTYLAYLLAHSLLSLALLLLPLVLTLFHGFRPMW